MSYPSECRRAVPETHVGAQHASCRVRSRPRSLRVLAALAMVTAQGATAATPFNADPLVFQPLVNVLLGQMVESAPATVSGVAPGVSLYVAVFDGEVSKGCTGVYAPSDPINGLPRVSNGDTLCVRHMSAASPDTVVWTRVVLIDRAAPLSLDRTWGAFRSNTGATFDSTPDPLSAVPPARFNLRRGTSLNVDAPITGLTAPASPIVVTNGQYGIVRTTPFGGWFEGAQPDAYDGDTMRITHVASALHGTTIATPFSIGKVGSTFESTTLRRREIVEGELIDFDADDLHDRLRNEGTGTVVAGVRGTPPAPAWVYQGLIVNQPDWRLDRWGDFDGDGRTDLLWSNVATGDTALWLMNGLQPTATGVIVYGANWKATHHADFDGDGRTDLVWVNEAAGATVLWLAAGMGFHDSATLLVHPDWRVAMTADMNGDRKSDLVWRNRATGETALWFMDGKSFVRGSIVVSDPDWRVVLKGDFDNDGNEDLVWHDAILGRTALWLMDGAAVPFRSGALLQVPVGWVPRASGDFDGDGRHDLVFRDLSKSIWVSYRNGLASEGEILLLTLSSFNTLDFVRTVDENGDGYKDLRVVDSICELFRGGPTGLSSYGYDEGGCSY
jgi:hypothetical protein